MITDHIAMWVIRHIIVDCEKTQTLLVSFKILTQFQRENSVYLRKLIIRSCELDVRRKLQSLTFQQLLKLFLWTLVFAWAVSPLPISGIWLLKYSILFPAHQCAETRCETKPKENTPTPRRRNTSTEMMLKYSMWITSTQTQNLLTSELLLNS